jgi:hypothetical protein
MAITSIRLSMFLRTLAERFDSFWDSHYYATQSIRYVQRNRGLPYLQFWNFLKSEFKIRSTLIVCTCFIYGLQYLMIWLKNFMLIPTIYFSEFLLSLISVTSIPHSRRWFFASYNSSHYLRSSWSQCWGQCCGLGHH